MFPSIKANTCSLTFSKRILNIRPLLCLIFFLINNWFQIMFEDGVTEFIDMSKEEDWEILSD